MAEQENPPNVPDSGDNTQTRKTVKLKVPTTPVTAKMAMPGQAPVPGAPIADPLSGRDTDTGNLDILSDTQTRKTVKLKPLSAAAESHPINIPGATPAPAPTPAPAAPAPAPAAPEAASTNTRKVLVLKPTPVKHTPVNPMVNEVSPSKQTMVLSQEVEAEKPAIDPAKQTIVLEQTDDNSDTVKVRKVDAPATPGVASVEDADDKTVKVQRPARPSITPAVAPTVPVAASAVVPDDDKATVKLARPAMPKPVTPTPAPVPAPAPIAPEAPAAKPVAEEAPAAEAAPKKLSLKKDKDEQKAAPPQVAAGMAALGLSESGVVDGAQLPKAASAPSMVYTIIAAITLILLVASAALSTVQYLNIHQAMKIELPVPGVSK